MPFGSGDCNGCCDCVDDYGNVRLGYAGGCTICNGTRHIRGCQTRVRLLQARGQHSTDFFGGW